MFLTTRKTLRRFTHGFTLIELLIVIAIMGILAAAVLIAINPVKRQGQARDANVMTDIAAIGVGTQSYFTQLGYYPAASADLVTNGDMKTIPTSPTNVAYTYAKTPSGCTTATKDCTGVSISYPMYYPLVTAGDLWCFQTSTGKPLEVTAVAGCPAL